MPAVEGIELAEGHPQPVHGFGQLEPGLWVRQRIDGETMVAAGLEERELVWKVTVDGWLADASQLGDGADRSPGRPHLSMQRYRGLDDTFPGLGLPLGAALELVLASFHA